MLVGSFFIFNFFVLIHEHVIKLGNMSTHARGYRWSNPLTKSTRIRKNRKISRFLNREVIYYVRIKMYLTWPDTEYCPIFQHTVHGHKCSSPSIFYYIFYIKYIFSKTYFKAISGQIFMKFISRHAEYFEFYLFIW
jgi:hypothetical protein